LYLMGGIQQSADLLQKLGKHKTGVGCLYLRKLSQVDLPTLEALIERSVTAGRNNP
jgi:hypothetical protein